MKQLMTLADAIDIVLSAVRPVGAEDVPIAEAYSRVAAADLASRDAVPGFANSAMDGFAFRHGDLGEDDGEPLRVVGDIPAGSVAERGLKAREAMRIMTGAPLPEGADTVVQVELTRVDGDALFVEGPIPRGANVREAGEDLEVGTTVVERGRVLRPADMGLLAAAGVPDVPVARRPRVAILATGSELVDPGEPVGPGLIRNSNGFTALGQVLEAGAEPVALGVARDDRDVTRRLLEEALEYEVVITSGGVSVGDYDFVKAVQDDLGVRREFWGVKVKPGKPMTFGTRGSTLVFGVPGNPVAAMTSFEVFVRPALLTMMGRRDIWRPWFTASAAEPVSPTKERAELRRCHVSPEPEATFSMTGAQGSGILSSMALADGLVLLPTGFDGAAAGERLPVMALEGSSAERPPFPS